MLYSYDRHHPSVHPTVYMAPGCRVIGDVVIEEDSSVWFNAVLRGDLAPIRIGKRCNIQDLAVGHVNRDQPLIIEDDVSVGHSAIVHACTIRRGALIGMGAIVMSGAEVGEYALVGAGAVVTENMTVPPRTLVLGVPAKVVRTLDEKDIEQLRRTTGNYVQKGKEFMQTSVPAEERAAAPIAGPERGMEYEPEQQTEKRGRDGESS